MLVSISDENLQVTLTNGICLFPVGRAGLFDTAKVSTLRTILLGKEKQDVSKKNCSRSGWRKKYK